MKHPVPGAPSSMVGPTSWWDGHCRATKSEIAWRDGDESVTEVMGRGLIPHSSFDPTGAALGLWKPQRSDKRHSGQGSNL